jgi:hypothetical protein
MSDVSAGTYHLPPDPPVPDCPMTSPTRRSAFLAAAILALAATTGAAQEPGLPAGWRALTDGPARFVAPGVEPGLTDAWNFTRMPPGWHITTGPGVLLYDPTVQAQGRYRLETEFFLFPDPTEHHVGIFFGGSALEGSPAEARWLGLLVRRDGTAGIVRRNGSAEQIVVAYARSDSLPVHPGNDSQRITLAVDAEADSVRFFVNRARLAAVPRADLQPDGHFGFRVGPGLNLHVVRLDYTTRLAPARGQ